jgi:phage I-like protein
MFDYDHQVVADVAKSGSQAKAAGWIKPQDLQADDDGIWGEVEWTPAAATALADREYRYVSPFFLADKKTGELTCLLNAALVNMPALELPAAAAQSFGDPDNMKPFALALGLAEDADEATILAAIATNKTAAAAGTSLKAVATALALSDTATGEEIVAAATSAKAGIAPDASKFVPISELTSVRAQLDTLLKKDAEGAVDAAITAGKLTPANRDWGLASYRADPAAFATAMGNQPTVIKSGEEGGAKAPVDALNEDQKAWCKSMGWDEAAYLAQLKSEAEGETL